MAGALENLTLYQSSLMIDLELHGIQHFSQFFCWKFYTLS